MVFTKQGRSGKRVQPEAPEQVAKKCTGGKVNEIDCRKIERAVDAFRKKWKTSNVELGGSVITFLENISLAEDIISTLRKAQVIPQNAKVLDFPERETKSSNATPWIATFKGESAVHPDILYNVSVGRTGTTLVYIVECEKLIEYRIFGRKKNVILPTDKYHVEKLNSPGSWLSFPSIHYHYGSGPKRTIISLTYVQYEETGEEKLKKIHKRARSG